MTINFTPKIENSNIGCFYWGWFPACELQLFIFVPWLVYGILSLKSNGTRIAAVIIGLIAGIAINFFVVWYNNMDPGLFAPQDKLAFHIFINKPYTKIYAVFLGIGTALMYSSI